MAWTDKDVCNGKDGDPVVENGFLNSSQPSPSTSGSLVGATPERKRFEVKETISYANILRSRNKFSDALSLYETVLENDAGNVEAHIGKGICLQMKNMGRLAFDSFMEAIKLDAQNACALTHCGILYKDEGRLREAAEVCSYYLTCYFCGKKKKPLMIKDIKVLGKYTAMFW